MNISHPKLKCSGLDRDVQCELALAPEFERLIDAAIVAGWQEDEIANALLSLSQDRVQFARENAFVGVAIPGNNTSH